MKFRFFASIAVFIIIISGIIFSSMHISYVCDKLDDLLNDYMDDVYLRQNSSSDKFDEFCNVFEQNKTFFNFFCKKDDINLSEEIIDNIRNKIKINDNDKIYEMSESLYHIIQDINDSQKVNICTVF